MTVDEYMAIIFHADRRPRSEEFRAGVRAALEHRINGAPIEQPNIAGSAQADAFDAGVSEGDVVWRSVR